MNFPYIETKNFIRLLKQQRYPAEKLSKSVNHKATNFHVEKRESEKKQLFCSFSSNLHTPNAHASITVLSSINKDRSLHCPDRCFPFASISFTINRIVVTSLFAYLEREIEKRTL